MYHKINLVQNDNGEGEIDPVNVNIKDLDLNLKAYQETTKI